MHPADTPSFPMVLRTMPYTALPLDQLGPDPVLPVHMIVYVGTEEHITVYVPETLPVSHILRWRTGWLRHAHRYDVVLVTGMPEDRFAAWALYEETR
jgi:hypothetical protein